MAAKRDLYEVLGISKTADEKAIKKAYRKQKPVKRYGRRSMSRKATAHAIHIKQ